MDLVALLRLGLILTTVAADDLNDAVRGNTDSLKLLVDRLDRLTIDFYTLESKLNVKMQTMFDELKSAINNMQALPIGTTHHPELQQNMKNIIEGSVQKQVVIVYRAFEAEKRQLRKLKSDIQSNLVTLKSTAHDRFTSINETLDRFVQLSEEKQKETGEFRHEVNRKIDEIKADMHDYDDTLKNVNETLSLNDVKVTEMIDRNSDSISSILSRVVSNEISISSLSRQMSSSASDISQLSRRVSSNSNSISSQSSRISDLYLKIGYCTRPSDNNNGTSDKQYYKSGENIKCAPDFEPATESVCQDGRWSQEPRCVPRKTCNFGMFTCEDGQCIPQSWYCDGDADCLDKSDEKNCYEKQCDAEEFRCSDSTQCINQEWKCDGDFDCADHSDETNCAEVNTDDTEVCPASEFKCTSGECIHMSWLCDNDPDCTDASDEGPECPYECKEYEFQCANKHCIADSLRCDHTKDCIDGSDEEGCSN